MFERRLKIFLGILVLVTAVLLGRAAQLQVVDATRWQEEAAKTNKRVQAVETVRGTILDRYGRELAVDAACMSAAVDYRAIVRDEEWIKKMAIERLKARSRSQYARAGKDGREQMVKEEMARINAQIDEMWRTLARESHKSVEEIEQIKAAIVRRVLIRRRYLWYKRYELAKADYEKEDQDQWLKDWLLGGDNGPQLDSFEGNVGEETSPHVILPAIDAEVHNRLKKQIEQYPGLVLQPGKHREYPYGRAACHVLGHLGVVQKEDLANDPNRGDDLRRYYPNDLVGRDGVENMCEQALRGTRGQLEIAAGRGTILSSTEPVPGRNVHLTIDIELQKRIEAAFEDVKWTEKGRVVEEHEMHGAVVVIDVPTGGVLAMVSYPTFDPNQFDEEYPVLSINDIDAPLLNRATQMAIEPGSTVKPMVGVSAVTQGLLRLDEKIECTGFMYDSKGRKLQNGRCWTATMFLKEYGEEAIRHHKIPSADPHPDGFLTLSDAIQRSCNVFFEHVGERLGLEGLSYWYSRFGLGRKTEIGLGEVSGRLPKAYTGHAYGRRAASWYSAIGQNQVLATPLQMANVAATIARGGIWMRPRLVLSERDLPTTRRADDRVDLQLSPGAVAAAKEGMWRVVNTRAGSAHDYVNHEGLNIAGKTGTAQVGSPFRYPRRDSAGKLVLNEKRKLVWEYPPISTRGNENRRMRWYRGSGRSGTDLAHAWFICFAPYENPRVAFAVVLEYGGGGGRDAAPITNAVLDALVEHDYLVRARPAKTNERASAD